MATQNGSTLATIGTNWRGRATAPANELRRLTKQAVLNVQTNGNGTLKSFSFAHTLDKTPSVMVGVSGHADSNAAHTWSVTPTNVVVTFPVAPQAGTNNVKFAGMVAY